MPLRGIVRSFLVAQAELLVIGHVFHEGEDRVVKVLMRGEVGEDGTSLLTYHALGDPLRGELSESSDPLLAEQRVATWCAMAEVSRACERVEVE